jgi:GNAT superfamily N-acetyltransferase
MGEKEYHGRNPRDKTGYCSAPMVSSRVQIRPARPGDHAAFAALFPELAVDDPTPDAGRFERDLMPTTILAEEGSSVLGYAYFQVLGDLAYVRHVVVAKGARRAGVGRALMEAIRERGRAAGATRWCLNVKPDNEPAIALYERCGLAKGHRTHALRIDWSIVPALPEPDAGVRALPVDPSDDGAVEKDTGMVPGLLADARAREGRVLLRVVDGAGRNAGAAIFDTAFPGAYPFKAAAPGIATALLRAMRPHARPSDAFVNVVVEDQEEVARALLGAGATLRLEIVHMAGPITPA